MIGNKEKPRSYAKVVEDSTNEEEIECQLEQPIPKGGLAKDKISEGQLLRLFLGMDIYFMGIALHVEKLDTKL